MRDFRVELYKNYRMMRDEVILAGLKNSVSDKVLYIVAFIHTVVHFVYKLPGNMFPLSTDIVGLVNTLIPTSLVPGTVDCDTRKQAYTISKLSNSISEVDRILSWMANIASYAIPYGVRPFVVYREILSAFEKKLVDNLNPDAIARYRLVNKLYDKMCNILRLYSKALDMMFWYGNIHLYYELRTINFSSVFGNIRIRILDNTKLNDSSDSSLGLEVTDKERQITHVSARGVFNDLNRLIDSPTLLRDFEKCLDVYHKKLRTILVKLYQRKRSPQNSRSARERYNLIRMLSILGIEFTEDPLANTQMLCHIVYAALGFILASNRNLYKISSNREFVIEYNNDRYVVFSFNVYYLDKFTLPYLIRDLGIDFGLGRTLMVL